MSRSSLDKYACWRTLQILTGTELTTYCILVGDFSVVQNNSKKRGGIFGLDPFCLKMKEIMVDWDLLDIILQRGRYTLSNMCMVDLNSQNGQYSETHATDRCRCHE
jgi:hypothetical protein